MSSSSEKTSLWVWWVCCLLLLASTINYMDRQTLANTSERITREFKLSEEQYGSLELAFGLAFAVGASVFGFIADKTSVRWLYPTVLLLWSAMGFATGLVETYAGLLLCRLFLGLFEAGHWPCALKTTQRLLPSSKRTLGNSVLQSGTAIGAMVTPLIIKSLITDQPGSWRPAFQIVGAIGIVWVALWLLTIKSSDIDGATTTSADKSGATSSTGATGGSFGPPVSSALPSALTEKPVLSDEKNTGERRRSPVAPEATTTSANESGATSSTGATGGSFGPPVSSALPSALIEKPVLSDEKNTGERRRSPVAPEDQRSLPFLEVIFSRKFLVLVIVVISINLCWHQFRVWMQKFLIKGRGYDEIASLDVNFWFNVMTDIGCLTAGFTTALLHRRGQTPHVARCWVFGVCSLLVASGAMIPLLSKGPMLIAVLMTVGIGSLGLFPCYYAFTQELSVTHQGKVTGSLGTIAWVFPSLWHWQFGRWVDQTKSYDLGMCLASLMPLVAITALCLLWPKESSHDAVPAN